MIGKGRLVAGMAVATILFLTIYSIKSIKEVYDREPKTLVDVSFDLSRIYEGTHGNSSSNITDDYSTDSIDATFGSSMANIYLHTPYASIDNDVDDYDKLTVVYLVDAWSIGDRERLRAHYPVSAPVDLLFGLKWSEDLEWKYLQTVENARYGDIVELVAESYWVYATYRALARRQNMKGWIVFCNWECEN
ncbi:hypothetical protein E3Q02_00766 [Wallemia mellicola]|uniref:Uncharacterized protein n=1 Tax=Wallemia mellicola TaxID=1708541 RepID=A0AB38MY52_9BASI|nr:hypothetical protein E3Q02_00766 [Wallemia mellicola]